LLPQALGGWDTLRSPLTLERPMKPDTKNRPGPLALSSRRLRAALLALTPAAMLAGGCGRASHAPAPSTSTLKYDSATNVGVDGVIDQGVAITDSDQDGAAMSQVREQLKYAIGLLNGIGGGVDLAHATVELGARTPLEGGRFQVAYTARFLMSWPREYQVPATYPLVLPARADAAGRQEFMRAFGDDEHEGKACLSDDAHDVSTGNLWYYLRPLKQTCSLATTRSPLVHYTTVRMTTSTANTNNKYPEYAKVWEDGQFVVTAVFGKETEGATADTDPGITAFRQTYDTLVSWFGAPVESNLPRGQRPSAALTDLRLKFNTARGPLVVALLLVDSVPSAGRDFIAKYEELTERSDFVAYNGHAGLGANIRALTRMGRYVEGQYQIFMLNGCDSLAYVDDYLRTQHQAVNPGAGLDKFVDVISNSRPSLFNENARATSSVIFALAEWRRTYRQILSMFETSQRAVVTGEQDNRWPAEF
jgi:hypothetical protein